MTSSTSSCLRRALIADGVASGAMGLLLLLGASVLERILSVPAALLGYAGLSLIPFAAFLLHLSRREGVSRTGVWAVIAMNAAWVAGSVLVPAERAH